MNCAVHADRPAVQACDRCGTFSCAECLAAVGSQQQCVKCRTRGAALEWDQRRELGLFRAWWLTSKRIITAPMQTFDVISPDGTVLESSIFAAISALVGFLPTMLVYGVIIGVALVFGPGMKEGAKIGPLAGAGIGAGAFLFYLLFLMLMVVVSMLLFSGLELAVLRVSGVKHAGYAQAVRSHALSMATYVIGVIPFCGFYVFPIYALVLRIFAIQRLQKVTTGQAAASALVPLGLCCFLGGTAYIGLFAAIGLLAKR